MFLFSSKRYCPECHSKEIRKSRRWGFLERFVLPLILLRPFRCETCNTRYIGLFFAVRGKEEPPQDQPPGDPSHEEVATEDQHIAQ